MTRREAPLALLRAACPAVLPGCSASGPVSHYERVLVLSVDEASQTAEVRVLGRPDEPAPPPGQEGVGAEGGQLLGLGADEPPGAGDDVTLTWIGSPSEDLFFPVEVYDWEPAASFCESP